MHASLLLRMHYLIQNKIDILFFFNIILFYAIYQSLLLFLYYIYIYYDILHSVFIVINFNDLIKWFNSFKHDQTIFIKLIYFNLKILIIK